MDYQEWHIDYRTGAGNETVYGTLEQAKKIADDGAAYTQCDIVIMSADNDVVAIRRWVGVNYENGYESESPILFGTFGFYDDWEEE